MTSANLIPILDRMIIGLTFCYGLVSCAELNTLPATFVSAALILGCIRCFIEPVKLSLERSIKWAILGYWAVLLLSTVAAYPDVRFSQVWSFVDRMLTLPLVLLFCRSWRQLVTLTICIVVSAFVANTIGLYQLLQTPMLRIQSVFGNPMPFGEHIFLVGAFIFPLTTLYMPSFLRPAKLFFRITLLLSIISLVFNQTRAIWIAGSAVWLALLMLHGRKSRHLLFGSVVLSLLVAFFFILSPGLQTRLISISSSTNQSNTERLSIWQATVKMIADHPLLGVGPDNFGERYQTRYILPSARERHQRDAHNTYLSTAAELGLLGLIAFLNLTGQLLIAFFRRARQSVVPAWPLAGFLVVLGFCIYGTMNSLINTFWAVRLFWLMVGISFAADNLTRQCPLRSFTPNP